MKLSHIAASIITRLIPRSRDILVFSSFPDYTDNAYALHRYLEQEKAGKYRCIWLYSDKESAHKHPEVKGYYKYTFQAFYYFARARYVFGTHGIYNFLKYQRRGKLVNLWHGMPLKAIGCMDPTTGGTNQAKADFLIATSPFFKEIMHKSFENVNINNVLLTGQPRNDLMFSATDFFKNRGIDRHAYHSVGIWLPTFRQSIIGDIRQDGHFNNNGISFLSMDDLSRLDTHLQATSSLLIVKLHPMDALQLVDFSSFTNLLIIKPKEFNEQLYPLLGACDYLLTDYSSVWIDYSILKRPIGFAMNDIEEYRNSRGLTIDNLSEKLPGTLIDTYDKLADFISNPPTFNCPHLEMFNTYCDNKASERIANHLKL